MKIKIITDSASDVFLNEANDLWIKVIPLKTYFGEEEYLDGVTLSYVDFYNKLASSKDLPKTSQITPIQYKEAFEEALKDNDYVICITLSKHLSGCNQSAVLAKNELDNPNVFVIDSENATIGEKLLVLYAYKLIEKGLDVNRIVELLEKRKKRIRVLAILDTLEYLKKGGRISTATALIGSLLSIKPIVGITEGKVISVGKARGSKNGSKVLKELIARNGNIDYDMPYTLAYSGVNNELLVDFVNNNQDIFKGGIDTLPVSKIGSTIETYVGPNAYGLAFFTKN